MAVTVMTRVTAFQPAVTAMTPARPVMLLTTRVALAALARTPTSATLITSKLAVLLRSWTSLVSSSVAAVYA